MKVQSLGCASATRKAVTLSKPLITQTNNTLNSNFTDGNQWLLNGNVISGATAATYNPVQSGKYQVQVTLANGCVAQSDNYVYAREGRTGNKNEIGLSVFPVPVSTDLNVVFAAKEATTMKLSLINALGEAVYQGGQQNIDQGNYSTILNVSRQTPGVYVLRVLLGQKVYSQKVIITR